MLDLPNFDQIGMRISGREESVAFREHPGSAAVADSGYTNGPSLVMLHPSGSTIDLPDPAAARAGENILMGETHKYPGVTHLSSGVTDVGATDVFVARNGIAISGRRASRGARAVFIRDPDRNVLNRVGPGPSVADVIADQVHAEEKQGDPR